MDTKEPLLYDFQQKQFNIVLTSGMNDERMSFIYSLIKMFQRVENTNVKVVDFVEACDKKVPGIEYFDKDFDRSIITINNEIIKNRNSEETTVYFMLGIGELKNSLSPRGRQVINNLFTNISTINNVKFVLIDVLVSYKNIQIEPWYSANIDGSYGIWLDKDAANQLVINVPNITVDERKLAFPYIAYSVNKGRHTVIKHMIDEEDGDSNEK